MINLTDIIRPYFARLLRRRQSASDPSSAEIVQRRVLAGLLGRAARCAVGERYGFGTIGSYERFASTVPVSTYEDIRPDVMRMVRGEKDILWPGRTHRFAQSSGTSGGKSKYIPVTAEGLRENHYGGASLVIANYLAMYRRSSLFGGKSFILGGSFANEVPDLPAGVRVGDLSANLIEAINPLVNLVRVPSREIALMSDWHLKLPALVKASAGQNITNISGVPSWFLTVLRGVLQLTGATELHDVWPGIEVFFHGGISFAPYREQYNSIIDPARMRYVETYNASEGFFALQDRPEGDGMRLLLDSGVFYEFLPLNFDEGDPFPEALPVWKVEPGRTYALVISSCNGLWRYLIGDTVRIESAEPLRISIAGRTNSYINTFGEELMVWNADEAIRNICHATGASIANYTAAPVYTTGHAKGRHQWLIEWNTLPPEGTEDFADRLDRELCRLNSDYQAKRSGNIFLDRLQLTTVRQGLFDDWLESTGKLGGQRKIPRLCNDRHIIDSILELEQIINKKI